MWATIAAQIIEKQQPNDAILINQLEKCYTIEKKNEAPFT
jgi:hypothetical protein